MSSSAFYYMLFLVLVLLWRPNLDLGFLLTPTYIILVLAVPLIICKRGIALYRFDIFLFVFYFFSLLTSSYAPDPGTSVRFFFGVMVFIGLYFGFKLSLYRLSLDAALSAFGRVGKCYFAFTLIFYSLGLLSFVSWQEHQLYYGLMVERGIPRLVAFGFDPNMSAMTLIPFIFYFLLSRKSYVWFSLGLFLLFATMSRGAVLSMVVGLTCLAIFRPTRTSIGAIAITFLLVVIGVLGMLLFDMLPINYWEQRISGFSSGSGRIEIWLNALEMFSLRPVTGWGGFSFRDVNQLYYDDFHFAHNTYLEVLVECGVIGLIIFATSVFLMLKRSVKMSSDSRLLFVLPAFFSFSVSMFFLSIYINQIFVFYLSLLNFSCARGLIKNG
ncbi:O-antigen ligase family protein [Pseudomonas stutzeri]|nr:O-antigen ligase family protein [Stutzerimonas stutzeri]MCQ4294872.1 O-antigen ligase family protein [Stutzerimonas stutzeri]